MKHARLSKGFIWWSLGLLLLRCIMADDDDDAFI
jgi:hypothetical protein